MATCQLVLLVLVTFTVVMGEDVIRDMRELSVPTVKEGTWMRYPCDAPSVCLLNFSKVASGVWPSFGTVRSQNSLGAAIFLVRGVSEATGCRRSGAVFRRRLGAAGAVAHAC